MVLGLGAVLGACGGSDDDSTEPTSRSTAPVRADDDDREVDVGRFASENPGSVNTFWLPAPDGLIVVDSGRNVAGGREAVVRMQATGEPVVAILVTHPHPDHVGGLGVLHEAFPDAPIYASEATTTWMRTDPLGFYPLARQADPDFPAQLTFPDHVIGSDETMEIGGTDLETAEFELGESETATAIYEPGSGTLFSGDVTAEQVTPALLEGHTCGWLVDLDLLGARFPDAEAVYPGHGEPGEPVEQIDEVRSYLQAFRDIVRATVDPASADGEQVTADEKATSIAEVERRYPNHPRVASVPNLQELNVEAVAKELVAEDPATVPAACRD